MTITTKKQNKRLRDAINMAGPRYTSGFNVGVSISSVFDGFGRTFAFYNDLKNRIGQFISAAQSNDAKNTRTLLGDEYFIKLVKESEQLVKIVKKIPDHGGKVSLPFQTIQDQSNKVIEKLDKGFDILRQKKEEEKKKNPIDETKDNIYRPELFTTESNYLNRLAREVRDLMYFARGQAATAANKQFIILRGEAGSGKTHFLCDLSKNRLESKLPTLIFLGQEFNNKDPWKTILQKSGWSGTKDQFLQSLEKNASNKKTRAFIIVDAINEQRKDVSWTVLYKDIKKYKSICLVLSIRMGFEFIVLSETLRKVAIDVIHEGFADREWDALTSFFQFYNLEPDLPLLFPDFTNPLFLKIFCETYQNNGNTVQLRGHLGFTHIFEQYVIKQGKKALTDIGSTNLDAQNLVWRKTIKKITDYMVLNQTDRIPVVDAEDIARAVFPTQTKEFLGVLENNWLLLKNPVQSDKPPFGVIGFDYSFPYQKFSDHLIVRHLLSDSSKIKDPKTLFASGGKLNYIMTNWWKFRGVIDALAVQIPERFEGQELILLADKKFRDTILAKETFLHSLVWRGMEIKEGNLRFFNQKRILGIINKIILKQENGFDDVMETMLTVCAIPKHPLNALLLSGYLGKFDLANKDKIWLPFLFYRHNNSSAVDRLIHWSVKISHKTSYDNESIKLVAITLGWFLSSSNRHLRDESTKALVVLLRNRIAILIEVLKHFVKTNDPYIQERLLSAAYGCAMTTSDPKLYDLGLYVYKNTFSRKPPIHLLIRDNARGIIETAMRSYPAISSKIQVKRILPPYGAKWPEKFPALEYLKKKYKDVSYGKDNRSGYASIWSSLMYNNEGGIADFGNYVINSAISHWANVKLKKDGTAPKSQKQIWEEFLDNLDGKKRHLWEKYQEAERISFYPIIFKWTDDESKPLSKEQELEIRKANKKIAIAKKKFEDSLTEAEKKRFKKDSKYLNRSGSYHRRGERLDEPSGAEIQRWIFKKVIQLGWTPELFHRFDSNTNERGRSANKSERIGKKYQWIALHEILARLADNYAYKRGWGDYYYTYQGPWDIYKRDIDPSHNVYLFESKVKGTLWWMNKRYNHWRKSISHTKWVKNDDASKLADQFFITKDTNNEEWIILNGSFTWKEPEKPGADRNLSSEKREVWIMTRAFITKEGDTQKILDWAKSKKNTWGWVPEPSSMTGIYLGEYPNSSAYIDSYGSEVSRWRNLKDDHKEEIDLEILPMCETYMNEATTFDCSVKDTVHIYLPSKEIIEELKLVSNGKPGEFVNQSGELVVQDPSILNGGENCLVIKKKELVKFLKNNNYSITWSVLGEKRVLSMNSRYGMLEFGGTYIMDKSGKFKSIRFKGTR